jgi:hypothetical protein
MSDPLPDWTPEEQEGHRRDLLDALDDIAWDPGWPALAAQLVPGDRDREGTVQGTWCVLASQKAWIRRQAWDERVSEGVVLRRVLADHLAAKARA